MHGAALTSAEEWRRGRSMVLACFLGFSFFSIMGMSVGVFMDPLAKEFGWSRTLISSGVAITSALTALLSPFFGVLIDRYGARKLALPGLIATAFAISCFGLASGSATQWLFLWGIYGIISISVKTTVWTAAVVGSFSKAQGLALGIVLCGTAATQIIVPPLATWLIEVFGWRLAYVWLGCGWGGVTLLICYMFLYDAHDRKPMNETRSVESTGSLPGLTLAEARRDPALWRIGITTFIFMLLTIGLMIHQIPILTEAGISRSNAAWLASLAGAAGIIGKLVSGALLDRYRPNWIGGLTVGVTALSFFLLIDGVHTPALIVSAMVINGYAAGSKLQIASYLTARYGGMRNFGVIYGLMTSLVAIGSGAGPMVAGLVYDVSGSYTSFLIAGGIGALFCGFLLLTLPAYPIWRSGMPSDSEAELRGALGGAASK